jgi:hypothetical protein
VVVQRKIIDMPATKNRFSCNHRGFGKFCHRCAQADALEAKAKALPASSAPSEGEKKGKGGKSASAEAAALIEEAKRLRAVTTKRSSYDDLPDIPVSE